MTSKVLTKAMLHNGRQNIRRSAKVSFIILAMHILAAPAILINAVYNILSGTSIEPDEIIIVIAVGTTFIAGIGGIIIALNNFRYLYKKSQVDICLSQPMTRRQRFFSDYFSGLISYIAPFIAVQLLSALMLLICHLVFDGKDYYIDQYSLSEKCTFFGDFAPIYGKIVFVGILMMIMLYTITVFVSVCCGALFETAAYTIFINGAIPAAIALFYAGFFSELRGVDLTCIFYTLIMWTSPVGGIVALYNIIIAEAGYSGYYNGMAAAPWAAGYIVVTILIAAGAYFLYMKRKAEQVSKPFVFKGFYYVVITFITFCVTSLFIWNGGGRLGSRTIAPLLIVTAVIYMLLEVISRRGFRRIWAGIIRYAVTIGVFLGFYVIVSETDGFGIEKRVPDISSVSKIHISYDGLYSDSRISQSFRYYTGKEKEKAQLMTIELTSPENIEAVVNAHRIITENLDVDYSEPSANCNNSLSICYFLKNGSKVVRNYSSMPMAAAESLITAETSEEYKEQYISYVSSLCAASYDTQLELRRQYTETYENRSPRISVNSAYDYSRYGSSSAVYPDREFFTRLGAALESDLRNLSLENYLRPSSPERYRLTFESEASGKIGTYRISVTKDFIETIKLFYEYGFIKNDDLNEKIGDFLESAHNIVIKIYNYDEYKAATGEETVFSGAYLRDANTGVGTSTEVGKYVTQYSDELAEIAKAMYGTYITDEPCYTIRVDGTYYVIPPEYNDIAEKVYNSAVKLSKNDEKGYRYYNETGGYYTEYY